MISIEFIRTVRKSGTSLAVNIPPEIVKIQKIKKGDLVQVLIEKVKSKK